jgi:protease II
MLAHRGGQAAPDPRAEEGTLGAPEQVILDVNRLAEGKQFMSVAEMK